MILKKVSVKELKEKPFSLVSFRRGCIRDCTYWSNKIFRREQFISRRSFGNFNGSPFGALYSIGKTSDELINLINQAREN
jgi:hypothetical protein